MNLTNPTQFGNVRNPNEPDTPTYPENPRVIIQPPVYYPIPPTGTNTQGQPTWTTPTGTTTTPQVINTVTNNNPTSAQCSCLIGQAYIDNAGNCGCSPTPNTIPVKTVDIDTQTGAPIIYYTTPQNTTQTVNAVAGFDVGQFVTNNPLLVGGVILGIIFLATRK